MERTRSVNSEIHDALGELLREDPKVILLGQDIRDPFGGCFRITRGLSTEFPDRVINTPISEAAVTGVAIGLAMQGWKPVVEFMFYDFIMLAMDQIVNHAMEFHKNWYPINLTLRATLGKPDYGFQHTKNMDYLLGKVMPIYRPTPDLDVKAMVKEAVLREEPTLIVEDSQLYPKRLQNQNPVLS